MIILSDNDILLKLASGKVICLEQVVLRLIDRCGFVSVLNKIVPVRSCDITLRSVFGSGLDATEPNVRTGLSEYIDDLRKDTGTLLIRNF